MKSNTIHKIYDQPSPINIRVLYYLKNGEMNVDILEESKKETENHTYHYEVL